MHEFKEPASGLETWVDFSRRMKGPDISDKDWDLFYNKYGGFIAAYCVREYSLSDDETAEVISYIMNHELFQRKVLQGFSRRGKGSFRAWFSTLIRHRCLDMIRKRKKSLAPIDESVVEAVPDEQSMEDAPDDRQIWDAYVAFLAIEKAAEKSTNQQTECFLWRCRDNRKPAEIAMVLGISAEQVSEAVRSFKDKITAAMRDLGETLDMESLDWKEFQQKAESAKNKYLQEVRDFSIRKAKKDAAKKEN